MKLLNGWFSLKSRSLTFDIILSFFILLSTMCVATAWYAYQNNSKALLALSEDLISETGRSSIEVTLNYLNTVKISSQISSELVQSEQDISPDNKTLIAYMRTTLSLYPFMSSIYIGAQNGNFLQIRNLPNDATFRGDPTQLLPGGTRFALRFISTGPDGTRDESWYYTDEDGKVLDKEVIPRIMFDHRTRDWYSSVLQNRAATWSDVYIFNVSKNPGITAANPIIFDGKIAAVMAVDLEISQISNFLQDSKIGKNGESFIFSPKGEIIVHSKLKDTVVAQGEKARTMLVNDLKSKPAQMAYALNNSSKRNKLFFAYEGIDYIAYFYPISKTFDKNWAVAFVVPVDVFIGSAKDANIRIVFMAIVILLFSALLVFVQARRIAKPIVDLANEAIRIRNFQLESNLNIVSPIREIQLLNEAMLSMRQSMRTFAKFIPKVLVSKLMKTGQELTIGGKNKRATLLFTDVANFTSLSENFPPDKLVIHLSEYFEEITQIIMQQNGIIDKYIGDAVMAFWGAPTADKMQAFHACKAALLFKKRLHDLNRKWHFEGKPELPTRIGIHTGEVIVGNVGSSDRMNYTALGDAVNLASRLEGVNKFYGTEIIISQEVLNEVNDKVLVRPLDIVAVKGKNQGVQIYELLALVKDDPTLLPTEQQSYLAQKFAKAYSLYLDQKWDQAIQSFEEIEKKLGLDLPTKMYLDRCKDLKKNPPGPEWNGIIHLNAK